MLCEACDRKGQVWKMSFYKKALGMVGQKLLNSPEHQLATFLFYDNTKWLFYFPIFPDIEDLPPTVQEKLFDEVLDRDVQKGKCSWERLEFLFTWQ